MRSSTLVLFAAFASLACDAEEEILQSDRDAEIIVENLLAAGFPADSIEVFEDARVIVGGDAVVPLEASYELAGLAPPDAQGFRQYRTSNLVVVHEICVDGSNLEYDGNLIDALDYSIAAFNDQDLSFVLRRTGGLEPSCDALITAYTQPGTGGLAGFPSGGLPYDRFYVGTEVFGEFGVGPLRHLVMHELGHCVGLRHSDYFDRSISCGTGGNEGPAGIGAIHIAGTPTQAALYGSTMNSCYSGSSTGNWTPSDIVALNELYGVTALESFCDQYDGATIGLRTDHGRFVRAGDGGEDWCADQQSFIGPWEQLTVECHDGGLAALRTAHGRYLRAGNASEGYAVDQQTFAGSWERLVPIKQDDGRWAFGTIHGRYLRAGNGGEHWELDQQTFVGAWERFEVVDLPDFCGTYDGQTIALGTAHGRYVRAGDGGEGWDVDQQDFIGSWERFDVECHGSQVALRTAHGRYLRAGGWWDDWELDQQTFVGEWERFTPWPQGDGTWAFGTSHGYYLRAGDGWEGWDLDQQDFVGAWERFTPVIP